MSVKVWDFKQGDVRVRKYKLYDTDGRWLGDVVLESNDALCWGKYYSVTDYGNYGYDWGGIGKGGFDRFLIGCSDEYLIGKLAMGHDERRVFDPNGTRARMAEVFSETAEGEDADWIGAMLAQLQACEDMRDFLDWTDDAGIDDGYEYLGFRMGGYLNGYKARLLQMMDKRTLIDVLANYYVTPNRRREIITSMLVSELNRIAEELSSTSARIEAAKGSDGSTSADLLSKYAIKYRRYEAIRREYDKLHDQT